MVNDPSAYSKASFAEVNERLAIDLVVWVDVRGTTAEPVVSYVLETSSGRHARRRHYRRAVMVFLRSRGASRRMCCRP